MKAAGLPQGAIENSMMRDGVHPGALYDNPLNNPGAAPSAKVVIEKKAEKPAAAAGSSSKPSGMSMMEEMKWKQEQKQKQSRADNSLL